VIKRERENPLSVVCGYDKTFDNLCHLGCGDAKSEGGRARERGSERTRERESERARDRESERERAKERNRARERAREREQKRESERERAKERESEREKGPMGSWQTTNCQSCVDT